MNSRKKLMRISATGIVGAFVVIVAGLAIVLIANMPSLLANTSMPGGVPVQTGSPVDTGDIDDNTITFNDIDYTQFIGGNSYNYDLGSFESYFSNRGLAFEGQTADTFEGLLAVTDVTSDRWWALPDFSGNVLISNQPDIVNTGMIADSTILEDDLSSVNVPGDEQCLTYESTEGDFEWQSCGWVSDGHLVLTKENLVQVITDDPDFKAALITALSP